METKFYGTDGVIHSGNALEGKVEEFRIQGFTVLDNLLDPTQLSYARESLDQVYHRQEMDFGKDRLALIQEQDLVRCPFSFDEFFLSHVILNATVIAFIKAHLGDYFLLHLQNGIINRPKVGHHQSSWHRDLPYQNYIISKPIAIGVLFCIDEFSDETGGTFVLPFSHQLEAIPSLEYLEKFQVQITAKAGSALVFNAMVFHRAGYNQSQQVRRGINNVYTVPIIKQQLDLPRLLNGKYADNSLLRRVLGYENQSPSSVMEFRAQRLDRLKP